MELIIFKFKRKKIVKLFALIACFILAFTGMLIYANFKNNLQLFNSFPLKYANLVNQSSNSYLGTNLNHINDSSTEMPFLDAFKTSRQWITQCKSEELGCSGSWSTNELDKLDLDEQGWVKSLPAPEEPPEYTRVGTLLFRDIGRYPGGRYVVLYDGEGNIEYKFDATKDTAASKPGRDIINVTPSNAGIYLIITSTDPNKTGNYLRNIRVIQAEYEETYQTQIFNPKFIKKINPFKTIRFMNWIKTNDSNQSEWKNRPKLDNASYGRENGVPLEIMVELANRLKSDPWFNIPHMATDEYITNFAQLVKESLNPELKVYVEFSNEVWNSQFKQQRYALQQGQSRWGKDKKDAHMQWYGMQTAQMCDIWKSTFGNQKNRVVCVMGTQTAWKGLEESALECSYWVAEGNKPCYQHGIDVYAIAGYFGRHLGDAENSSQVESWLSNSDGGFGKAFKELSDSLSQEYENFIYHANVAKQKGLKLVAYEGGQHIVGRQGVENNDKLTNFFIELNRRPEMYELYTQLLNQWKRACGTLFIHYCDIRKPSKWGSFGALEYLDQDSSPKYDALIDFLAQNS
ncbi:MAG: cellulose-binding protein [Coleofasciculus sp. S288]|nr:cellulose-binding protein [Coleofasciculus sp. S288]